MASPVSPPVIYTSTCSHSFCLPKNTFSIHSLFCYLYFVSSLPLRPIPSSLLPLSPQIHSLYLVFLYYPYFHLLSPPSLTLSVPLSASVPPIVPAGMAVTFHYVVSRVAIIHRTTLLCTFLSYCLPYVFMNSI